MSTTLTEGTLSKIFYFPKLLLLFPAQQVGLEFRISFMLLVISASMALAMFYKLFHIFALNQDHDMQSNNWLYQRAQVTLFALVIPLNLVWVFKNIHLLNSLSKKFLRFDCFLKEFWQSQFETISRNKLVLMLFFGISTCSFDILLEVKKVRPRWGDILYDGTGIVLCVVLTHQIYGHLSMVEVRFGILVGQLIDFKIIQDPKTNLEQLLTLFHDLCRICEILNWLYGLQIILLLSVSLATFVVFSYYIYEAFCNQQLHLFSRLVSGGDGVLWIVTFLLISHVVCSSHVRIVNKVGI